MTPTQPKSKSKSESKPKSNKKITVFTGNQPRHIRLVERLVQHVEHPSDVFVVTESSSLFPGMGTPFEPYFNRMLQAERQIFGVPRPLPAGVTSLHLRGGDLQTLSHASYQDLPAFTDALQADHFILFGSSYVHGELAQLLIQQKAICMHMGIAPEYRGSAPNFWALYDRRPELVGATIHLLDEGSDTGPILFHAFPTLQGSQNREEEPGQAFDPFIFGMEAVRVAHDGLVDYLFGKSSLSRSSKPTPQDSTRVLRLSEGQEFTPEIATNYLSLLPQEHEIKERLDARQFKNFVHPYFNSAWIT